MVAVPDLNWKDGQGYVLVFSITSRESFDELPNLRKKIAEVTETSDVRRFPFFKLRMIITEN